MDARVESRLKQVRAWDWPTRAFHWLLVFTLASAWVSFEYAEALGDPLLRWHRWNGYVVLVLVVFRLMWGVAGSSTARFAQFVRGPAAVLRYARDLAGGHKRHFLGHNPLGTMMILLLLTGVAAQAVLGLFTLEHNEIVAGPLKRLLSDEMTAAVSKLHVRGFNILLLLVVIHVLANVAYSIFAKDPVVKAMVTGTKPALPYEDGLEAAMASALALRAGICLLAAIVLVFGGIILAGGRL